MEFLQMMSEVNWSSLDSTMSMEESDMTSHLFGICSSFPNFYNDLNDTIVDPNPLFYNNPLPPPDFCSSNSNEKILVPGIDIGMDFCMSEDPSYLLDDHQICSADETICSTYPEDSTMSIAADSKLHSKRKFGGDENDNSAFDLDKVSNGSATASPTKKARSTSNANKSTRTRRSKKSQKNENKKASEEEERNGAPNGQSSSCYTSEDDSNASNEKNRAERGSATDPQSLYARKRRERINERLRILQNLVPNGTKVDLSTMLEEAVNYVKFLQLQIKLLSSDDLWMYAPLAYNGMDIGLDLHYISTPKI